MNQRHLAASRIPRNRRDKSGDSRDFALAKSREERARLEEDAETIAKLSRSLSRIVEESVGKSGAALTRRRRRIRLMFREARSSSATDWPIDRAA